MKMIKIFDKILLGILSCLGLFACSDTSDDSWNGGGGDRPITLYGVISTNYRVMEIKGTVTDISSKPIKNIRVISPIYPYYSDTVYTDVNGKYNFSFTDYNGINTYILNVDDIDGNENGGEFVSDEKNVVFTPFDKVESGSGYYKGKYSKILNIKLTKK